MFSMEKMVWNLYLMSLATFVSFHHSKNNSQFGVKNTPLFEFQLDVYKKSVFIIKKNNSQIFFTAFWFGDQKMIFIISATKIIIVGDIGKKFVPQCGLFICELSEKRFPFYTPNWNSTLSVNRVLCLGFDTRLIWWTRTALGHHARWATVNNR